MTISNKKNDSSDLLLTERGEQWLDQFVADDKEIAKQMISNLTFVSDSEFSQVLQKSFEAEVDKANGSVAFYAVREIKNKQPYFNKSGNTKALSSKNNHGSEARIAHLIRNYCKTNARILLNHPCIKSLRHNTCRNIIFVDDLIGSGKRTTDFLNSFWKNRTIRSWHSSKYITFHIIVYSASNESVDKIKNHKAKPKIEYNLLCPTFKEIPLNQNDRKKIKDVCLNYGRKTSRKRFPYGYGDLMAAIIFEHSCPNNTPVILWSYGQKNNKWIPLFPNGSILSDEKKIFSQKNSKINLEKTLLEIGHEYLATAINNNKINTNEKMIITILALIDKGHYKISVLTHKTKLDDREIKDILQKCKNNELINYDNIMRKKELTVKGMIEFEAIKKYMKKIKLNLPKEGEDYYYPKSLRETIYG